jgi:hypothetical protein
MFSEDTRTVRRKRFRELFKKGDVLVEFNGNTAWVKITALGEDKFLGRRLNDFQERAFSMTAYPWVKYEVSE